MDGDREVTLVTDEDLDGCSTDELDYEEFEGAEEVEEVGRRLKTGFDLGDDDDAERPGRRMRDRMFSGYYGGYADPEVRAILREYGL